MVVMMLVPRYRCARSVYVLASELRPLLAQNNILNQYRSPKRADPDQPNAISLCSTKDLKIDILMSVLVS